MKKCPHCKAKMYKVLDSCPFCKQAIRPEDVIIDEGDENIEQSPVVKQQPQAIEQAQLVPQQESITSQAPALNDSKQQPQHLEKTVTEGKHSKKWLWAFIGLVISSITGVVVDRYVTNIIFPEEIRHGQEREQGKLLLTLINPDTDVVAKNFSVKWEPADNVCKVKIFQKGKQVWNAENPEKWYRSGKALVKLSTSEDPYVLKITNKEELVVSKEFRIPLPKVVVASQLVAKPESVSTIKLSWTDTTDQEVGFKIERRTEEKEQFEEILITKPNVTSYLDDKLNDNTTYHYRVTTLVNNDKSPFSNVSKATTFEKEWYQCGATGIELCLFVLLMSIFTRFCRKGLYYKV